MSIIFYDHLITLGQVEKHLKALNLEKVEQEELWGIIDELIHKSVFQRILEILNEEFHHEFLEKFYSAPHHSDLLLFIKEYSNVDPEVEIKKVVQSLEDEIITELKQLLTGHGD